MVLFRQCGSRQLHGGRGHWSLDQKISTSPSVVPITVGSEPVTVIVNFGVAQKRTVSGRVYVDSSNDGYTPGVDTVLVNARVKIIQDTDGDGMMDYGEPLLGEDVWL